MKHAIEGLDFSISRWKEDVSECNLHINRYKKEIKQLTEGETVDEDENFCEGLTTIEEKVNYYLQRIDKLIQERKGYESIIQEHEEAIKILQQHKKQSKKQKQ